MVVTGKARSQSRPWQKRWARRGTGRHSSNPAFQQARLIGAAGMILQDCPSSISSQPGAHGSPSGGKKRSHDRFKGQSSLVTESVCTLHFKRHSSRRKRKRRVRSGEPRDRVRVRRRRFSFRCAGLSRNEGIIEHMLLLTSKQMCTLVVLATYYY
jgi:hypothetical protein